MVKVSVVKGVALVIPKKRVFPVKTFVGSKSGGTAKFAMTVKVSPVDRLPESVVPVPKSPRPPMKTPKAVTAESNVNRTPSGVEKYGAFTPLSVASSICCPVGPVRFSPKNGSFPVPPGVVRGQKVPAAAGKQVIVPAAKLMVSPASVAVSNPFVTAPAANGSALNSATLS